MTSSEDGFWFNRLIEYWTLPEPEQVLDHVRRGHVQVVQMGNFGPDFYSLADDSDVDDALGRRVLERGRSTRYSAASHGRP